MNIFVLSLDPKEAAVLQMDAHVVKMTLETLQLLSSAANFTGGHGPYKDSHVNHPCAIWARASTQNFGWLRMHGLALGKEYKYRYGKIHKCYPLIADIKPGPNMPDLPRTPFAQAMPDEYKNEDVVKAYRAYYLTKSPFARWTKRNRPDWFPL